MICAASPGTKWIIRKVSTETPNTTERSSPTRSSSARSIYLRSVALRRVRSERVAIGAKPLSLSPTAA